MFELEKLNYEFSEFQDKLSFESFKFHYLGHHQAYVDNLNNLLEKFVEFQGLSLEEIIKKSYNKPEYIAIFNNSAQVWNHNFFWKSIHPYPKMIEQKFLDILKENFKEFEEFRAQFCERGTKIFGSGWIWLVFNIEKQTFEILETINANTPIVDSNLKPIFVFDVWEHAYYIDYRNKRKIFLETLFSYINWEFAFQNYLK